MFKHLKKPKNQFLVSYLVLIILIGVLALPALTIRTFGEEIEVTGKAYGYQDEGGSISFELRIQEVPLGDISNTIIEQIETEDYRVRLNPESPYYLWLELDEANQVSGTYLSDSRPGDDDLYLEVHQVFSNYDYESDGPARTITGVTVHFQDNQTNNQYYMSDTEFESLNFMRYETNNLIFTIKIYRGEFQVIGVRKG